jgi:hypothetical protein
MQRQIDDKMNDKNTYVPNGYGRVLIITDSNRALDQLVSMLAFPNNNNNNNSNTNSSSDDNNKTHSSSSSSPPSILSLRVLRLGTQCTDFNSFCCTSLHHLFIRKKIIIKHMMRVMNIVFYGKEDEKMIMMKKKRNNETRRRGDERENAFSVMEAFMSDNDDNEM